MRTRPVVPARSALALSFAMLAALAAAPAAFSQEGPKPKYFVDESKLPFTALPGATAHWGVHNNAGFRAEYPDDWNGTLVVWAHGFRGSGL
jgi:hypothetical protein